MQGRVFYAEVLTRDGLFVAFTPATIYDERDDADEFDASEVVAEAAEREVAS